MTFTVIAPRIGSKHAPPDSEAFAVYWYNKMLNVTGSLQVEPSLLASTYEEGVQTQAWRKLKNKDGKHFETFDEFCEAKKPWGLETSPEYIRSCIALAQGKAVAAAVTAPEIGKHGTNQHGGGPDNIRSSEAEKIKAPTSFGTSAEYRAARLKRDAPEVFHRLASGEFPSVAAAWREAGLEKKPDPKTTLVRKFNRLPYAERMDVLRELLAPLDDQERAALFGGR